MTREFYADFGFSQSRLVLESERLLRADAALVRPRDAAPAHDPRAAGPGAGIEPVRLRAEILDCRGEWGHLGPMEFAIGVTNLDQACNQLRASGVDQFRSDPQTVDVGTGEWRYAYFHDPDGLCVSVETVIERSRYLPSSEGERIARARPT